MLSNQEVIDAKRDAIVQECVPGSRVANELFVKFIEICDTALELHKRLEELKDDRSRYL